MLFYFVFFINLNQIRWSDNILCCQTGVNSTNLRRWILSGGEAIAGAQLKQLKYHHSWWNHSCPSIKSIGDGSWPLIMFPQIKYLRPCQMNWGFEDTFSKQKKKEHAAKSNLNKSILSLQIHKNFPFWVLIFCKVWFSPSKTVTITLNRV